MKFMIRAHRTSARLFVEINEDRFRQIVAARATCLSAIELEDKFALFLGNYFEFELELLRLAEASRNWPTPDHSSSMDERLILDRRIVNFLTAGRLYLDQVEHVLSTVFGANSSELEAIRNFKHDLYDQHTGYRFIEALRNHVQHAGLPLQTISYHRSRVGGELDRPLEFSVIPLASVSNLLENPKFNALVRKEIQTQKEIDLRRHIREYTDCIGLHHEKLREITKSRVTSDRELYENVIPSACGEDRTAWGSPHLNEEEDNGVARTAVPLVTEFLEHYDSLVARNITSRFSLGSFSSNSLER